jgi:protein O-GlcNAc transferase
MESRHEGYREIVRELAAPTTRIGATLVPLSPGTHVTSEEENRALFFEAMAQQQAGQAAHAEKLYRELLSRNPRVAPAHNNLGMLLDAGGQSEDAEICFRAALALRPDYPEALNNLGALVIRHHRVEEAIACFRRALALRPENIEPLINLADTLLESGSLTEVEDLFKRALRIDPKEARAYSGLAQLYADTGRSADAINALSEAVKLHPASTNMPSGLFALRRSVCAWEDFDRQEQSLLENLRTGKAAIKPFFLISLSSTPDDQLRCARAHAQSLNLPRHNVARGARAPGQKIRLGYASADFNDHPVSNLAVEMFERHDRSKFEVVAYSHGHDDRSAIRLRLEKSFDRFIDVRSVSDAGIAQQIANDEIDILVDLTGYTRHLRPGIFSRRPAPIQVNYLGYPGTLGVAYMDYIIVDAFVVPPEQQRFFSEKCVYLPHCYQVNSKRDVADTPVRSRYGLPETGFVFCCFNKNNKLTPRFFDIWMRLLHEIPESVLWLMETSALATANLQREAHVRGIDPRRLIFAQRVPSHAEHLARHRLADLFLDTLPYNAHTTMSDALWSGLPALTCVGDTLAGRTGGSILRAAGLDELVTSTPAQYEMTALTLARDKNALAHVRQKLVDNLATTPLFDCARYTRNIEKAYTRMVDIARAGKPAQPIIEDAT